jgi:hypothetical protein
LLNAWVTCDRARFGVVDDDDATRLTATIRSAPVQQAIKQHGFEN